MPNPRPIVTQMVFRLLAVLVALGLLVGSAQAHTPSGPIGPIPVLIDQVDEADDVGVLVTANAPLEESRARVVIHATDGPPGHQPCRFVFRPPRTCAFN